jgi:hypothetical protein
MRTYPKTAAPALLWISALVWLAGGCCWISGLHQRCCEQKTPTPPLGTISDPIWRQQEAGAAASDFVVYQGDFQLNEVRLNMAGEDHLKSIAMRLRAGAPPPVVVERSMTSVRPDSKYKYPVNPSPELDMRRRDVVVRSLMAMGIANADQCVVVAPALAPGISAAEAARAYERGHTGAGGREGGGGMGGGGGFADTSSP